MAGVRYYPKLQVCVPFSPVTGPRLLTAAPEQCGLSRPDLMRALASGLKHVAGGRVLPIEAAGSVCKCLHSYQMLV